MEYNLPTGGCVELISDLWAMGRWAGLILLLVSAGGLGFFLYQVVFMDWFFILFPAMGLLSGGAGLILLFTGSSPRKRRPDPMLREDLLAQICQRPMPYFLCTDCRHFVSGPRCDHCGSEASVLEVGDSETPASRRLR